MTSALSCRALPMALSLAVFFMAWLARSAQASGDAAANAGTYWEQGASRMEQGDYLGALGSFRRAHDLAPSPRTLVQIGLAEQALERWVDAEAHLSEGLAARSDPWVERRRRILEEALEKIRSRLCELLVEGSPAGAEVLLDGEVVGVLPFGRPLRVVAGRRTMEVRAPGFHSARRQVALDPGGRRRESFDLVARPPPPLGAAQTASSAPGARGPGAGGAGFTAPATKGSGVTDRQGWFPLWRRLLAIGGLAAGGAAVALGAGSVWLDGRESCATWSPEAPCGTVHDTAVGGWLLIGSGSALLVVGTWALSTSTPAPAPAPGVGVKVALGPSGLKLTGRF
jgi:hypothetical protein